MAEPKQSPSIEYARSLYADVLAWYHNADTKAQVILTLDGVFLGFLTSTIFSSRAELEAIVARFDRATWTYLGLMCISLVASIVSTVVALWSRLYRPGTITDMFEHAGVVVDDEATYVASTTWFFQHVSRLQAGPLARRLRAIDETFEIDARAAQIVALSKNVAKKHWAVDAGFVFFSLSLILFLAAAVSYLQRA